MRILHGPSNISGMAGLLSIAQRQRGHAAMSIAHHNPSYEFYADLFLDNARGVQADRVISRAEFRQKYLQRFDIYHFYFGVSFEGLGLGDFVKLARSGKQVFMTFCGCDVRDSKQTQQSYRESVCRRCWPTACSPNRELALRIASKYARAVFVSTVDLFDVIPNAVWMPQPVDLSLLPRRQIEGSLPVIYTKDRPLRIIHAPSDMGKKGSEHLIDAVSTLRADGYAIELDLLSGVPQTEVYRRAAVADIAVDQLVSGTYGSFAVEMMAIGLPTICYMRPSWSNRFPDVPPIISADKDSIRNELKAIAEGKQPLERISLLGQDYVRSYHSADAVSAALESKYKMAENQKVFSAVS